MIWLRIIPAIALTVGLAACTKALKSAKAKSPLTELAGSEWGPVGNDDQFVQFKVKGEVIGNGGCNSFFGSYDLAENNLTFGPIASTKKMCPNIKEETSFINALRSTRSISATHIMLVLFDENGDPLLELRRRDWD